MKNIVNTKILIIDDEPRMQHIYREIYESIGHSVATAYNGDEALNHLYDHWKETGFILLDKNMPAMYRRKFMMELSKIPEYSNIPVVIHTFERSHAYIKLMTNKALSDNDIKIESVAT